MFNSVQYVRDICRQRKIPVSQLEKECGFSNGYLNPKKMTKIPYDRAQLIADYLGISATTIMTGESDSPESAAKQQPDILDEIDVAFYGDYRELSEDDKETLRAMARLMKERRAKRNQEK